MTQGLLTGWKAEVSTYLCATLCSHLDEANETPKPSIIRVKIIDGFRITGGGLGLAEPEMRDYQLAVITEMLTDYRLDGVELDFAAPVRSRCCCPGQRLLRHARCAALLSEHCLLSARTAASRQGVTAAFSSITGSSSTS